MYWRILRRLPMLPIVLAMNEVHSFTLQISSSSRRQSLKNKWQWRRERPLISTVKMMPVPEEKNGSVSSMRNKRMHRTEQIEMLQGVWWTSDTRDQLVRITSSYAIFDAPQSHESSPPVMYPFGGTDEIVTLRTFKLDTASLSGDDKRYSSLSPNWISSPISKVRASSSDSQLSTPTSSATWERCTNIETHWQSKQNGFIPGYEASLTTLIMSGGSHWSSSPVDIVRACISIFKGGAQGGHLSLSSLVVESESNKREMAILPNVLSTSSSLHIVKYHHFSPDVCTVLVQISGNKLRNFQFCLSRDKQRVVESKLPTSLLYDSVADIELCAKGKVWMVDHVRTVC